MYGAYLEWYLPRTPVRLTVPLLERSDWVTSQTHHESLHRMYDCYSASRRDDTLEQAQRVQSASEAALRSLDKTSAGYKFFLNHFCHSNQVHRLTLPLGHLPCTSGSWPWG